jgi:speckle-type POZ protein
MPSVGSGNMKTRCSSFQFEIYYSKAKDLRIGEFISSPIFTASGYDWFLEYYPLGCRLENNGSHDSLYLCLENEVKKIIVEYSFQVLDKKGQFITLCNSIVVNFTTDDSAWGYQKFLPIDTIEELYCVNGTLGVSCSIRVLTDPKVVGTYPGGLCKDIEKFWKKERFDVTFEVEGESISAHRFILAARSPVFESKLFGPMADAKMELIKINKMKAEVFKALLHFVYTDELAKGESSDHETLSVELLQDLFVAANRYGIKKLTLLCEDELEKNLSVDTVVATLLLADRHSRAKLKKKCLEFASSPENFSLVALTEGYLNIMPGAPLLVAELSEMVIFWFEKKQRTYWHINTDAGMDF